MENDFPFEEVQKNWSHDNFLVKENNSDTTVIFFSSNAIHDNTVAGVRRVIENNYYEWMTVSKTLDYNLIFIRDLSKSYFHHGISNDINSMEKLYQKLAQLTKGKKVITCGISAGGHAAALFGCRLKADHLLVFSGQFGFYEDNDKPMNIDYLINLIKESKVPIYYICPIKSVADIREYKLVENIDTVKTFKIISDWHGFHPCRLSLRKLLSASDAELLKYYKKAAGKELSAEDFEYLILGYFGVIKYKIRKIRASIKSYFRK